MPMMAGSVKLKQFSAQAAMQALSSVDFWMSSLAALWRWSQSAADMPIVDLAADAKPTDAGSKATDRPIRTAKMVRPMRIESFVPVIRLRHEYAQQDLSVAAHGASALIFLKNGSPLAKPLPKSGF